MLAEIYVFPITRTDLLHVCHSYACVRSYFLSVSTAQILWENRLIGDLGTAAKTSFDGVHFKTKEPRPDGSFWNGHYSHKFKSAGLSYLVGLSIQTGHIVWVDGPWRAAVCDCKCFRRSGVMNYLEEGEKCEGDSHYQRNLKSIFIQRQSSDPVARRQADVVQARHEVINKLMRQFRVLSHDHFRHSVDRHSTAFRAAAVVTQLNIESGHPMFQVEYTAPAAQAHPMFQVEYTAPAAQATPTDWKSLTVAKLKDELRTRGLKVGGKKKELVRRLAEDDASRAAAAAAAAAAADSASATA